MSDPKRANLITVGAPKSAKKNVTKTVRLNVNLDESNESKYPELNYKELVAAAERKKKTENGKTGAGLFSDNDDDVERVARKFEQKYGSKSTYGKKGRKKDEFADIGAGYDENDSFIDNTDGYDEMIPPECDTLYGGFYINSGSLEFKQVPERHNSVSDNDGPANRRNKRRISSSSSEDESSDSSMDSESQEKDPKSGLVNGNIDSHKTDHRKKKNKKPDKKNAKRIRRTDSAATSGKQTSDDNAHGDAESGDSRASHSDSLTSKPALSSENAITSDSSRDAVMDQKLDMKLPSSVNQILEEMKACVRRHKQSTPNATAKELEAATDSYVIRLEHALNASPQSTLETSVRRAAWSRAARVLDTSCEKLANRARILPSTTVPVNSQITPTPPVQTAASAVHVPRQIPQVKSDNKPAKREEPLEMLNVKSLSAETREEKINETLKRLKALIDERKPSMIQNYNNECERVREEKKKMSENASDGAPLIEKRLPKRRFPWCQRTRALLTRLTQLSADEASAARLLAQRALPLFPVGFVRIPTLLRQANLNRELSAQVKPSELKRHNSVSNPLTTTTLTTAAVTSAPVATTQSQLTDIHFPSSLTVTTMKTDNANESPSEPSASKQDSQLPVIFDSFSLNKNLIVETRNEKEDKHRSNKSSVIVDKNTERTKTDSDKYLSNNIGAVTITPVPNNQRPLSEKVPNNSITITTENKHKDSAIRCKSQATLIKEADEIAKKDKSSKHKQSDRSNSKHIEKRLDAPLHIDTSHLKEQKKIDTQKVSPNVAKNDRVEEISLKQIETMRVAENNIPRPSLVPVHHSPTFAKPDKPKKIKKDVIILSDSEPLGDAPTDDSDIELIEDISTVNDKPKDAPKTIIENPNSNAKIVNDLRVKDSIAVASNRETSHSNHKKFDGPHNSQHSRSVPKEKSRIVEKVNNREPRNEIQKPSNSLEKMAVDYGEVNVDEINKVMQNLREMRGSQEHIFNSNSYSGVITNAKHLKTSSNSVDMFREARNEKNKLTNFFEQNGWM